jgi:hypothetical protein
MRELNYPILAAFLLVFLSTSTAADKAPAFTRTDLAAAGALRRAPW